MYLYIIIIFCVFLFNQLLASQHDDEEKETSSLQSTAIESSKTFQSKRKKRRFHRHRREPSTLEEVLNQKKFDPTNSQKATTQEIQTDSSSKSNDD